MGGRRAARACLLLTERSQRAVEGVLEITRPHIYHIHTCTNRNPTRKEHLCAAAGKRQGRGLTYFTLALTDMHFTINSSVQTA